MTLFLTASSFYRIFTQVHKTLNNTVASQEVSRSVSETQLLWIEFVRFLHVTPDRLMIIRSLKSHWIVTINAKMHVWKCKLIFPTDTLQQKIEVTDLKPFLAAEDTSVVIISAMYL